MKIGVETEFVNAVYADVPAANKGIACGAKTSSYNMGTTLAAVAMSKLNAIDYIVDAGSVLNEQNIPPEGRWMLIPDWMGNLIKKSDQLQGRAGQKWLDENRVNCWNPVMGISSQAANAEGSTTTGAN